MEKPKYYVASFSGGKDSTAMVLHLMELGEPIDEVICCDTYKEFPEMYLHIEKVKKVIEDAGIKFTILRAARSFDEYMFEYMPKRKPTNKVQHKGKGWATARMRWCTGELKKDVIRKYFNEISKTHEVIQYIGLAADEGYRLKRESNQKADKKHPLVDWGWDEKTCLEYCYQKGYDWGGLYEIFDRVSCWCCPLKTLEELRRLRKHRPVLWEELKDMDRRSWNQFRKDYSVKDLEKRFELEEALIKQGQSTTNRAFHTDLKRLLAGETTIEDILQEREVQLRIQLD